jgi:hypothetical protein
MPYSPLFRSKLKTFRNFLPWYQCGCWFTRGLLVVSIHDLRFAKTWKISSPHSPLPDYMLGVLITPNRVEELTCIELIWRWHVYVIEGCSITYLVESTPLNQFISRTVIEKVGGGLGHLYLWLSTLAIFTLWNDMQCERRGPLSDSLSQSGLELNKLSSWLL